MSSRGEPLRAVPLHGHTNPMRRYDPLGLF